MDIINLYDNYNNYFTKDLKQIFELCSKIADEENFKIFLIGGIVRDMLLCKKSRDIDITVLGNAIEFAHILEKKAAAKISSIHSDFGTVKVLINGKNIDFASTRSESYPIKGHLPVLKKLGCPLEEDVIRRDFTINSLALSLNQADFANLIDYVGGYEDLQKKQLRILHDKSFIDDPTRIIRGLKYSIRLNFELESKTLSLQNEYLNNINYDMGYNRVRNELKLTFGLNSLPALEKFIGQNIYKLITKKEPPKIPENIQELINKYKPQLKWIIYFGLFAVNEDENFLSKFELTKIETNVIEGAKKLIQKEISADSFDIYKSFCSHSTETLILASFFNHSEKIYYYLDELAQIKLQISGNDLIALGYTPSKAFGDAFDFVLREKLNNSALTRSEEISLINQYFSAHL